VPQAGQHPAFHPLDPHCDLGLISGLGRPGRDHGEAIVLCEVRVGPIDLGFIAMRPGDGRFEVVGDDNRGDAAERHKGPPMRTDPVGQTLAPGGLGVGIVGGPQDRDKNGGLVDLPAVAIDDGDTLSGVIHKELLARAVGLPHDQIELMRPGAVRMTKPTVLHAVWRHGLILLPQQEQGDTLPFEFAVHGRPIGDHVRCRSSGRDRRKQQPLQRSRIVGRRQGPGQASCLSPMHILGDCRSTDAQTLGDLPLTQSLAPFEMQYLIDLTHG
jgi:hypothetical protein